MVDEWGPAHIFAAFLVGGILSMVGWYFGYWLVSVECHLKTRFLIRFPGVTRQEEAIDPSPHYPPPPFVSCPFCRRGFFCVCCILMVNLPLGICKRWSCLEEKIHYDPWATSRLEDCRNLCCCVSMHVAVKLVWEQRKPVCGSRVKWAVFWWASVFERS